MKAAVTVSRYLLGIMFAVFGLNGFLHFIPQPPPSSPLALQYLTVLSASHYFVLVFAVELVAGLLLLANRFVPLAVALLAPLIVNILMFHILLDPASIVPAVLAAVLWFILFTKVRPAFSPLLTA